MGQSASKRKLKKKEIQEFLDGTHFDLEEIEALYEHFKGISSSKEDDGVIDKEEFQQALGLKESLFVDRMFELFDRDGSGVIDFREFINGLSIFSQKGSWQEKMEFSFKIYDFDGDGCITRDELYRLLESSLMENNLNLSPEQLASLVDTTFSEADSDGDGKINLEEYRQMVVRHPSMISNMTISTPVKTSNTSAGPSSRKENE